MNRRCTTVCISAAALALALIAGCATAPRETAVRPSANLALGGRAGQHFLAEQFAGRSRWPAAIDGVRVEDVTYYETYQLDDQSFYERDGSGLRSSRVTIRSGTLVR